MDSEMDGGVKAGTAEVGGAAVIVRSEGQSSGVNILQNKGQNGGGEDDLGKFENYDEG